MPGFANGPGPNFESIMWSDNVDFSGAVIPTTTVTTNGQLLIGDTATPHIKVGNITSPGGTITVGYSTPNITLDLAGGGEAIDSIAVQTGTSPIVPTVAGLVTINGAVVAAGTNPVRTDGTGANTMALEVQTSQALAAADATKIGLCNFDSADFSVTATGFVTLLGGSEAIDSIGVDATSGGGTNPVLPTAAGLVTVNGARAAAGTNPIRTVSTAANVYQIQVQTSQALAATDATKVGLANFNSAGFGVDANGFVSQATSVAQLFTANTGTATPSSNNLNVLGGGGIQTAGSGATLTIAVSGGGFTWVDATSATQSLAVQTGYVTDHSATVVYTLPATAVLGDTIKIVGKLGLATITPNANQQILMGSLSGSVGATGTAVSTNVGDCIELICITAGASTVWRADNWVGTWVLS